MTIPVPSSIMETGSNAMRPPALHDRHSLKRLTSGGDHDGVCPDTRMIGPVRDARPDSSDSPINDCSALMNPGRSRTTAHEHAHEALSQLIEAIAFAAHKHRDQRRKNARASPYINHPIELARVLALEAGITDVDILRAAVLHDTIEDTQTTRAELERVFGARVAEIVLEVTDDQTLHWQDRKQAQIDHARHLSVPAQQVKLADKICNLRDVATDPPHDWDMGRRRRYFDWARAVIDGLSKPDPGLLRIFRETYARKP